MNIKFHKYCNLKMISRFFAKMLLRSVKILNKTKSNKKKLLKGMHVSPSLPLFLGESMRKISQLCLSV